MDQTESTGATGGDRMDSIDDLPLPYIEMDARGYITRANRATMALHPREHGELIGMMAWDLMATDEKEQSCAAFMALMESGAEPPVVVRSIYTRSGEFRIYEFHRRLKLDGQGRPAGMGMVCVDITETKKDLDEAHRLCRWQQSVMESMTEAVIVTDALGMIRTLNPAAEALLGWKAAEMADQMIENVLPVLSYESDDKTQLDFTRSLDHRRKGVAMVFNRENRVVRVEISSSPMLDKESGFTTGVVSVLRKVEEDS